MKTKVIAIAQVKGGAGRSTLATTLAVAGQWKYEIWIDGEEVSGGAGYENQFDAIEDALENNQHLEGLAMVIQPEP